MSLADSLRGLTRVFLDSAPVVYYVQMHPRYGLVLDAVFDRLDQASITAIVSPVTLAECVVYPIRHGRPTVRTQFEALLSHGEGVEFVDLDRRISLRAAEIRATHGFKPLDSLQLAVAEVSHCEAFVTNDRQLRRYDGLPIITLDDIID